MQYAVDTFYHGHGHTCSEHFLFHNYSSWIKNYVWALDEWTISVANSMKSVYTCICPLGAIHRNGSNVNQYKKKYSLVS